MAYPYYLVSYQKNSTEVISTNVYADNETDARAIGSIKLQDFYSISVPVSALTVEEVSEITSDYITTT
ncbi:MAG: hypothetical protein [Caudoviricetes sp.]|nr:MAG: hypothetical protein [Caudoviricetes sp.]